MTSTKTNSTEPLISIIVPCHNVEDTIAASLRSVSRQLYKNFEAICVENGSSDGTFSKLESLAIEDPRIKVITRDVSSPGAARMAGIEIAKGDFIGFLDGDDFYEVDFLSEMMKALKGDDADMVQCGIRYAFEDRSFSRGSPEGLIKDVHCSYRIDSLDGLPYLLPQLYTRIYRRRLWDNVTINNAYYEDAECLPAIAAQCTKITIIPDALYTYNKRYSVITGTLCSDLELANKYFGDLILSQRPYLSEAFLKLLHTWGAPLPVCVYANLGNYLRAADDALKTASSREKSAFLNSLNSYKDELQAMAPPDVFDEIVTKSHRLRNIKSAGGNPFLASTIPDQKAEIAVVTNMEKTLAVQDAKTAKNPNLWVFSSWGHYGRHTLDNPRAVFETVKNRPDIQKVILMNNAIDEGNLVDDGVNVSFVPLKSKDGLTALKEAGVIVTAYSLHNMFGYRRLIDSPDRKILQSWHGIPIKKIGLAVSYEREPFWGKEHERYHAIPSSSEIDRETMVRSFSPRTPEKIKLTGLPRHDFLKGDEALLPADYQEHLANLEQRVRGRPLVLLATTWRANPAERINFEFEELKELDALFAKHNAVLGIRLHPNMKRHGISFPLATDNIIQLSDYPDVNVIMRRCAAVVTDYSSLYLDFMLLERPVILYTPDIKTYSRNRGTNYAPDDFIPHGEKVTQFEDLKNSLNRVLSGEYTLDEKYAGVRERFHSFSADGKAAQRLLSESGLIPTTGQE